MKSSGSHFDHSIAHCHLVPLLTTLLSQVWNSTSNSRRSKGIWVAKRDPDQATESVEKDSEQMTQYIVHIVKLSQSWWCVDEFTFVPKPMYDDAVLYHSQKIFNIIMGYNVDGHFWNVKAPGLASLAAWCSEIDHIRTRSANHDEAWRRLHKDVESRMDRNKCDAMYSYETQRKRFIANYLRSNLGDRNMAQYLIIHGAPWLLQADNQKTKRALERSSVDQTKIYHLSVNFLRWWGRAMHTLSNYSNSPEVVCARFASSARKSERDKKNAKRSKRLQRALESGTLQYHELSVSQQKLLPWALLYNAPTPWTLALASTRACEESALTAQYQTAARTSRLTESKAHAEGHDRMEPGDDHVMLTLCFPPGLSPQSSAKSLLPAELSSLSLQEITTQPES